MWFILNYINGPITFFPVSYPTISYSGTSLKTRPTDKQIQEMLLDSCPMGNFISWLYSFWVNEDIKPVLIEAIHEVTPGFECYLYVGGCLSIWKQWVKEYKHIYDVVAVERILKPLVLSLLPE